MIGNSVEFPQSQQMFRLRVSQKLYSYAVDYKFSLPLH